MNSCTSQNEYKRFVLLITPPKIKTNPYLFEQHFTQNNESGLLKDLLLNNEIMG